MANDYVCIYYLWPRSGDYIEISADIPTDIALPLERVVIDIADHDSNSIMWLFTLGFVRPPLLLATSPK